MSCYQAVQDKLQAVARDWFLSDFVRLSQVEMETQYIKPCHSTVPFSTVQYSIEQYTVQKAMSQLETLSPGGESVPSWP